VTTTASESPTTLRRWALLLVVGAGLLLITLDYSVLYTALPRLTVDLAASATEALWIINAYPVVMAGLLLGSGTLGDRVGHRRMFLVGLVVFGVASVFAASAASPWTLIAGRAALAVGAAAMMPATLALIRTTFTDVRERTLAIAIWGSISVVGAALGPIVGGLLLEHFWWGSVFLVNVPVVVAALVATPLVAPRDRPDRTVGWDAPSSVLAMVGLVGAVVTIKELATPGSPALLAGAVVAALVGFVAFWLRQRGMAQPLLDFAIFRNAAFSSGVLAAGLTMFAIGGVELVTAQRFQLVLGYSPLEAGLLVAAVAVGTLPTALGGAAVLHRVGLLPLVSGGLAVGALGVGVAAAGIGGPLWVLVTGLVVAGAGLGAVFSVASSAIVGNVEARRAGMASSVEEVSYEIGSLTAVAVLGSLLTAVYTARAPEGAGESMTDALRTGDPGLVAAAGAAFDSAYLVTMIVGAAALAVGSVATGWLLRHHGPGGLPATLEH
jgi:MFS transporter, DHA2 family, multidrug resistance protein